MKTKKFYSKHFNVLLLCLIPRYNHATVRKISMVEWKMRQIGKERSPVPRDLGLQGKTLQMQDFQREILLQWQSAFK